MIPAGAIRRQPNPDELCTFYALLNLYVWAGLEPPDVGHMLGLARQMYTASPEYMGLRPADQFLLLHELRFPLLASLAVMPPGLSARECFPPLLDAGCGLVVGYDHLEDGRAWGHSVVAYEWEEAGVNVLCSGSAGYEGTVVEWERSGPADVSDERPHGCHKVVPWLTQPPVTLLESFDGEPLPGLHRAFVVVWPPAARGVAAPEVPCGSDL